MGYKKVFANGKYAYDYAKIVANTIEDVKNIPVRTICLGSEVYCLETNKMYLFDGDHTWSSVDGAHIDCDCGDFVEESTIWENLPEAENEE